MLRSALKEKETETEQEKEKETETEKNNNTDEEKEQRQRRRQRQIKRKIKTSTSKFTRECCQAFRSLLACRYFRKALLVRFLRSRGGECERGEVEQCKGIALAHGPPPFWNPFRENGVQTRLQKTLLKSTRHSGAKFCTQGPQSEPERDLWCVLVSKRAPKLVPKR